MRFGLKTLLFGVFIAALTLLGTRWFLFRPAGFMDTDAAAILVSGRHDEALHEFEAWLQEKGYERTAVPVR